MGLGRLVALGGLCGSMLACGLLVGTGGLSGDEETTPVGRDAEPADGGDVLAQLDGATTFAGKPVELASQQDRPRSIAVDPVHLYWVNDGTRTAMRVPKGGGPAMPFGPSGRGGLQLALAALDVFFVADTDYCGLSAWSVPKAGGAATPIMSCSADGVSPRGLALDPLHLYVTNARSNNVRRLSRTAGSDEAIATTVAPEAIAASSKGVAFTSIGESRVVLIPKPYEPGASVTVADGQTDPRSIAMDDESIVWTTADAVRQFVLATQTVRDVGVGEASPVAIALAGGDVFWANAGDGTIRMLPKGKVSPMTIAAGQSGPNAIAADGDGVYWTTASGSVLALRR